MTAADFDDIAMRRAIGLARRAWGQTHPNPHVGALIAVHGEVMAEGWHRRAGDVHAEVDAIRNVGGTVPPDATLYVTMEPCSTQGRTPPCTRAILEAGFRRVVVAALDPNPKHAGRGLEILRAAGVSVTSGVLQQEATDLNLIFNHWITTGSPMVALKSATTIDGRVATASGDSKWITGTQARAEAHQWRRLFPAIVAGSETILVDDPALTARLQPDVHCPIRFIMDRRLRTLRFLADGNRLQCLGDSHAGNTCVVTTCDRWANADPQLRRLAGQCRFEVLPLDTDDETLPQALINHCRDRGIAGILVEGGPSIASAFLRSGSAHYLFAYWAPLLFADETAQPAFAGRRCDSVADAIRLHSPIHQQLGDDQLLRGHIRMPLIQGQP